MTDIYPNKMYFSALLEELKERSTGRWDWEQIDCCITGKDADLEPWGEQGMHLDRVEDGTAFLTGHGLKCEPGTDVCLNVPEEIAEDEKKYDKVLEAYLEQAQEVVCGSFSPGIDMSGDWDGDSWILSTKFEFQVPLRSKNGEFDAEQTALDILKTFENKIEPWENDMCLMSRITNHLAGWHTQDPDNPEKDINCKPGEPGPEAVWNYSEFWADVGVEESE